MATQDEVLKVISYLLDAYPSWEPRSERFTDIWIRQFGGLDVSGQALLRAAELHVMRCKWFPSVHEISELLEQAAKLVDADQTPYKVLFGELMALEEQAREGKVDGRAFEGLALRFEQLGMFSRASNVRERALRAHVAVGDGGEDELMAWRVQEVVRLAVWDLATEEAL